MKTPQTGYEVLGYPVWRFVRGEPGPIHERLWCDAEPAETLWIAGKESALHAILPDLPLCGLAVVGTRQPSATSKQLVAQVLRDWISVAPTQNPTILSGLALGIDSIAHASALAAGFSTVAILAGGLHSIYPPENTALARQILAASGLLVSEFEWGAPPKREDFLKRNRIIAGWAAATWMVQAPAQSGALNTAKWSRDLSKETYATPCMPGDPAFAGNQHLLERGDAEPFWGLRSLQLTWPHLVSAESGSSRTYREGTLASPLNLSEQRILDALARLESDSNRFKGGITLSDLYDQISSQPALAALRPRLYAHLAKLIEAEFVSFSDGVLRVNLNTQNICGEKSRTKDLM